ncbi:hypothetical protein PVAG01_08870 [Phlyctema vagabunda]|uniref:Uncharacterized protein n=1 Tax=Phlyctema vagabunda TaxID=108571 RepID=A0ABR4PAN1_9HELO
MSRQADQGRDGGGSGSKDSSFNAVDGLKESETTKVTFRTKKKKKAKWSVLDLSDPTPRFTSGPGIPPPFPSRFGSSTSNADLDGVGAAAASHLKGKATADSAQEATTTSEGAKPITTTTPASPIDDVHPTSVSTTPTPPLLSPLSPSPAFTLPDPVPSSDLVSSLPLEPSSSVTFTNLKAIEDSPLPVDSAQQDPTSDPKSVQNRFESLKSRLERSVSTSEHSIPDHTASAAAAMGQDDGFDALEWDPSLPPASDNNSPEQLAVTPQPLAYTTVGSLVNPSAVPQFSAPNRIQREGAGRRVQATRDYQNAYFHHRPSAPAPALNTTHSMLYTQQLGANSNTASGTSSSQGRTMSRASTLSRDDEVFRRLEEMASPRVRAGNIAVGAASTSEQIDPSAGAKRLPDGENYQFTKVSNDLAGMENMQTLQRIAKYNNPFQEIARNRLSGLAATNAQPGPSQPLNGASAVGPAARQPNVYKMETGGDMYRDYRIPRTGSATPSQQSNPLLQARGYVPPKNAYNPPPGYPQPLTAGPPGQRTSTSAFNANSLYNTDTLVKGRTATGSFGPVHPYSIEESFKTANTSNAADAPNIPGASSQSASFNTDDPFNSNAPIIPIGTFPMTTSAFSTAPPFDTTGLSIAEMVKRHRIAQDPSAYDMPGHSHQSKSPWASDPTFVTKQQGLMRPQTAGDRNRPVDTLPLSSLTSYYPNGFPSNMDGKFTPLSQAVRDEMNNALRSPAHAAKVKELEKEKEINDWFYSGQRKFAMTAEDHASEKRNATQTAPRTNPFGPIGPPQKTREPVNNKPYTVEQMNNMKPAETAAPLVNAVYGSLLELTDEERAKRNGFTKPQPWQIDSSERGNESVFGEDWGPPPKRHGRDGRYQPGFHNPSSTHWE